MSADYSFQNLRDALAKLPLKRGDVVFSHSNLGFFGRAEEGVGRNQLCNMFLEGIMEALGESGTLVVPTFTYSFPRKKIFDPETTASEMGAFAEWIRLHKLSHRSDDPCYSVAAIGARAEEFTKCVPQNSFGPDSFFDRFYKAGGKILNLNFDAGSTFIHYIERCLMVPYRFDKTFHGLLSKRGELHSSSSTIWVRYLSDDSLEFDSKPFSQLAIDAKVFHRVSLGRGQIGVISASDSYELIVSTLPNRPLFLTRAETAGVKQPIILPE